MLFGIISTKDEIGQQLQQVINLYRVGKELEAEVILNQLKDSARKMIFGCCRAR